jgi:hypothetical protein
MSSRKEILRSHYASLLKRVGAWAGVVAILATAFVSVPTDAAQITSRSATLSDSSLSSTTDNVSFSFTFGSSYNVFGIDVELCNSPVQSVACTVPTGGTLAAASTTLGSPGGQCASFTYSSETATDYKITYATGQAVTSASTCTFKISGTRQLPTKNSILGL